MQRVPPLSRFEESPIRRLIIERLRALPVGEVITYLELSELVGERIQDAWHLVRSAREALLRERIVFDVVPTLGLKRLDDDGKVAVSEGYLDKVKAAGRRSLRVLTAANFEQLSPTARIRYKIAEVRNGIVAQFSRRATTNRIERAIEKGEDPKRLKKVVAESLKQF